MNFEDWSTHRTGEISRLVYISLRGKPVACLLTKFPTTSHTQTYIYTQIVSFSLCCVGHRCGIAVSQALHQPECLSLELPGVDKRPL